MRSFKAADLLRVLIGLLGSAALALACWQMAQRYLFPQIGTIWVEETVIYLIAWATFLGAGVLVYQDQHVRADVVVRMFSPRVQRGIETLNCVLGIGFCAVVAWYGYLITSDAYVFDERSVTGAAFPIWIFYAALPAGMILCVLWYVRRAYWLTFKFDPTSFSIRSGHDA